jgi:hypothetical protein
MYCFRVMWNWLLDQWQHSRLPTTGGARPLPARTRLHVDVGDSPVRRVFGEDSSPFSNLTPRSFPLARAAHRAQRGVEPLVTAGRFSQAMHICWSAMVYPTASTQINSFNCPLLAMPYASHKWTTPHHRPP